MLHEPYPKDVQAARDELWSGPTGRPNKLVCAYCARGPMEGVALKRVPGLGLYYCMNRKGWLVCR